MQTVSSWTLVAKNAIENFVPYDKRASGVALPRPFRKSKK
jgi:hypothetical protein